VILKGWDRSHVLVRGSAPEQLWKRSVSQLLRCRPDALFSARFT
jgi:hypothetical protein